MYVLTQFNSASLNAHIADSYSFDRFRKGFVDILAAEQTPVSTDWFQGTADAVRQIRTHLRNHRYDQLLVLSGDQLYTMDYRKLIEHHKANDADVSVATIPVAAADASGLGILTTDSDRVITRFHEKPKADELDGLESDVSQSMQASNRVYLASMGIYVFNHGVLQALLDENPDANDFGKQVIPRAIETMRVVSYPFEGYWSDIGTIRSFYDANLMLAADQPEFDMFNARMPLYTNARILTPAKIQAAKIMRSIVSEGGVIINATIYNSVIGLRSLIRENADVRNSIVMGNDYYPWSDPDVRDIITGPDSPGIGAGARIDGAIIDRNVSIGEGCIITNERGVQDADEEDYYIRDGIVVIPKNVSIPPGTVI